MDTLDLLSRWHAGERAALDRLLESHLPWIEAQVSRRLGPGLRARGDTQDYLHDAVLEILAWVPRFRVADAATFRRLLARLVENVLRDRSDWYRARRRAIDRERPIPEDTVLELDGPGPGTVAAEHELAARVRLGVALLEPEERRLVLLRQWEERSWAQIGEELEVSADAARMRGHRALARLGTVVERLSRGELGAMLQEEGADS